MQENVILMTTVARYNWRRGNVDAKEPLFTITVVIPGNIPPNQQKQNTKSTSVLRDYEEGLE
ncbi:hypothetical protein E2C01_010857 [Portunus trituberculatus]|uniref:Uncharacterized protein n=1 Tax=Portunus trituberculatus TaxID=210409 RepID=A0A5B7DA05_PORTR|nr:hypothetical protein [Portunus trituberculatus]